MEYPQIFTPNSFENFEINGQIFQIPKTKIDFSAWDGIPIKNTFGGKPLIKFNDNPMFAELAIMNIFKENGWNSRWIETYGKPKLKPIHLTEWMDEPYKTKNITQLTTK